MSPNPKKKFKPQRVIIPKGLVDPNEVTILEIPPCLKDEPVVLARKKNFHTAVSSEMQCNGGNEKVYSSSSSQVSVHNDPNNRPQTRSGTGRPSTGNSFLPNCGTTFSPAISPEQLQNMEKEECAALLNDLNQFQQARRNLILHTTSFASHNASNSFVNHGKSCPPN